MRVGKLRLVPVQRVRIERLLGAAGLSLQVLAEPVAVVVQGLGELGGADEPRGTRAFGPDGVPVDLRGLLERTEGLRELLDDPLVS